MNNNPALPTRGAYSMLLLLLMTMAGVVFLIGLLTRDRIADNERAWFVGRLKSLVPAASYDNDIYADRIALKAPDLLGTSEAANVYRARLRGKPIAAVFAASAPDGYGGPIQLLIAIDVQGEVLGVDVVKHSETPGIGDGFDPSRSNWLQRITGHSLRNPAPTRWTIRKDGGEFDQFTGSSITPRAILKAVRHALEYYSTHRDVVFAQSVAANGTNADRVVADATVVEHDLLHSDGGK